VHLSCAAMHAKTGVNAGQIRRETYGTEAAKTRSICALFVGLRLLFMVLGVIR
jgi:hypothetical protein